MISMVQLHGPLSHWSREGKTLVVRPLKKTFFMCVLPKGALQTKNSKFFLKIKKMLSMF